jgi:hypothetical protein
MIKKRQLHWQYDLVNMKLKAMICSRKKTHARTKHIIAKRSGK